jgi:hypothetical protein
MTAVADAAAVNHHHHHHHQFLQSQKLFPAHLQFLFQYHLHQDVQLDNIDLMEHAYGTLLQYQQVFEIHAQMDSTLMDMEAAFLLQIHQPLLVHQFLFLLAPQDITVMEMEIALLQHQFHPHHAQLDISLTEMEIVLHQMFHKFVLLDLKVMELEAVFQSLLLLNYLLHAQVDT